MNLLVRRALVHGVPAVLGVGAGAAGTVALRSPPPPPRPHNVIYINKGDTITPRYFIANDSTPTGDRILKAPGGGVIVGAECGASHIYLRNYGLWLIGPSRFQIQKTADTTDVFVCQQPSPVPVAAMDLCFIPADTAAKYGIANTPKTAAEVAIVYANCDTTASLTLGSARRLPPAQAVALWRPGTGPFKVESTR